MIRRLFIGTGNRKKLAELEAYFRDWPLELVTPHALGRPLPEPAETGSTFEENSQIKALAYSESTGLPCLADDSGLEVDVLGGRPGVWSARYAGEGAGDAANNRKLLSELAGVPPERRAGGYVAVITVVAGGRVLATGRGTCRGVLLDSPRGSGGFGYDPLFFVPALGRTFAELHADEKEAISHRGAALRALAPALRRHVG